MGWLEDIRNKPHAYKIRLMWVIISAVVVILILLWILFSRIGSNVGLAGKFFKEQTKQIQDNSQKLIEDNKNKN